MALNSIFSIKHGDTLPPLVFTLFEDEFGNATVDLTDAQQVLVKVGKGDNTTPPLLSKQATIPAPEVGQCSYKFSQEDWQTVPPGNYDMEFEVTWQTGDVGTYPKEGFATLNVGIDLDID